MQVAETREIKKGLTWRTLLAFLFGLAIVQPIIIYYYLITNLQVIMPSWTIILLWTEISRALGAPLSVQEIFMLTSFQGMTSQFAMWFVDSIRWMYMGWSPPAQAFGITAQIPDWWAPPSVLAGQLYSSRLVFFHSVWIKPILLSLFAASSIVLVNISLGYFCYSLYARVQKLEFPLASAQADVVVTLADREKLQMRALMLAALLGVLLNLVLSFIPFVVGPFLSTPTLITAGAVASLAGWTPATSFDVTPLLAQYLPGAGFSFDLSPYNYITGFLLPISVTASQLAGALTFYFVGTHLITRLNLWPAESEYSSSWSLSTLVQRSQLYFFISVTIGLSLAATVMPLVLHPRSIARSFKAFTIREQGMYEPQEKLPSLRSLLILFLIASVGTVLLLHLLAPDFPIWILIFFIVGGTFFTTFLATNAAGVTFSGFNVPYQNELAIYSSGYAKKDIWFASTTVPFMQSGGSSIAQYLMQADVCGVRKSEYVRTYVIVVALGLISSFFFTSLFWYISPIPSGAYPATINVWPVMAMDWARTQKWIWTGYLFRFDLISYSFLVGSAIAIVFDLALHMPGLLIAFIAGTAPLAGGAIPGTVLGGTSLVISYTLAQFIGSVLAQNVIAPIIGRNTFEKTRARVVLGFTLGWGFIEMLRATLILIAKSMWLLPY